MSSITSTSLNGRILKRTHILEEILHHIDEDSQKFDTVNYDVLKEEVLKPVLAESFNPKVQIRGFLKTFRLNLTYKAALQNRVARFERLDQ